MFVDLRLASVCGLLAAVLPAQSPKDATASKQPRVFEPPVRLQADGKDIEAVTGHAAPFVVDFDGDGVRDLAVGEFGSPDKDVKGGTCRLYRNTGTDQEPKFAAYTLLQSDGKPAAMESS